MTVDEIIEGTAEYFSLYITPVTKEDILGPRKIKHIVIARQMAMMMARDLTQLSYPELARAFNRLDHTTVLGNVRRARDYSETGQERYRALWDYLKGGQ